MEQIIDFILTNKEWLFSGAGAAILGLSISVLLNSTRKKSKVVRSNLNIQVGRDVDINIGDKSDTEIISQIKND